MKPLWRHHEEQMPPDAALDQLLRRARNRLVTLRAVEGAAAGTLLAAAASLGGAPAIWAVALVAVATAARVAFGKAWRWAWWRNRPAMAIQIERRTRDTHNLLVTAAELPRQSGSYVHGVVMKRASQIAARLDVRPLFPVRRAATALALGMVALLGVRARPANLSPLIEHIVPSSSTPSMHRVTVTVTPPAYSGLPRTTLVDPAEIEALANSRIDVRAEGRASTIRMETLEGVQALRAMNGQFNGDLTARTTGFIALEPRDSTGAAGPRRMIGLRVNNDRPPRVTLTAPGRDLFFSNVPGTIDVAVTADDDLALQSLQLRYTTVAGSGEQFTFAERDVPLTVRRSSPRSWTASGTWSLQQLQLAPGDLLVYRAIARDGRPGAPAVESESYVIEVVTPGAIAAEGFAADDQRDRYAASQQMVILKTERLIARRNTSPADSVAEEARMIAAEQRQVRAEFVFMMGGEVEDVAGEASGTLEVDETAEAEAEGDILAGRLQNRGRIEMLRAIRAMSRAATALTDVSLDQALRDERTALDNLMRAFSRSRFILRALTQRERIDLERRLSGSLRLTAGLSSPAAEAMPDERVVALRRLLGSLASLSSGDSTQARLARAAADAVAAVRSDPASSTVRQLAGAVQRLTSGTVEAVRIDSLVRQVTALIAGGM
ncbi:MAG TPA: hypothetical protein VFZ73_03185, partial [Gemmatimonadaceae bacterium]